MSEINWITLIGLGAAAGTTIAYLPQVVKSWKTKKTRDVSLPMYLILVTGLALWLIYGLLIKDFPIIIANSITLVLALSVLLLKIKHG